VFFRDVVQHVARLARIFRQPRGGALLVGLGGSGKASLARFAAHVAGAEWAAVQVRRGYGPAAFREDVKRALKVRFWVGT
jgi:dynein heavy chain